MNTDERNMGKVILIFLAPHIRVHPGSSVVPSFEPNAAC